MDTHSATMPRQRGAGLVETMVGILIGLIVVLVIYNLLSATEGYKRMANGASDAQVTGLLSQFILGREAANGGNGVSLSASDLISCAAGSPWRPVPVLIHDSGDDHISDSFTTLYSSSSHVVWPVVFTTNVVAAADPLIVQSPNGFTVPAPSAGTPYRVVAVNPTTGDCELAEVVAASAPDAFGRVTLTQGGDYQTSKAYATTNGKLINLGPKGQASRMQFEVRNPSTSAPCDNSNAAAAQPACQLYSRDLFINPPQWNPLAQNVVLMKVQYGVDLSNTLDGRVDCWTPADNSTINNDCAGKKGGGGVPTDFRDTNVPSLPLNGVQRIVALRVGIVVRDDEPDLKAAANGDLNFTGARASMYLFNCAANDNTCQGRIQLDNKIIRDGWRYRTYETVIPLRNAIFNDTP
jgi:type IV pilus assembly protein PilW